MDLTDGGASGKGRLMCFVRDVHMRVSSLCSCMGFFFSTGIFNQCIVVHMHSGHIPLFVRLCKSLRFLYIYMFIQLFILLHTYTGALPCRLPHPVCDSVTNLHYSAHLLTCRGEQKKKKR